MDTRLLYHEVLPTNLKSSYGEFDVVDFGMTHPNRKLNLGSVRITGELEVSYDGQTLDSDSVVDGTHISGKQIYLDHLVGSHALCESIVCSISAGGSKQIIENIAVDYARYVKMATATTSGRNDMLNSNNVCELKAVDQGITNAVMQGVLPPSNPSNDLQRLNPDFSFRPLICFNSGAGTLGYDKTNDCEVSITLARVFSVLYGNDVNSKVKYAVKNLRLQYSTSPMDDDKEPVILKTKLAVKQSIQSSFSNSQFRIPAVSTGVSCSFQVQANENTATNNNQELNKVPNLSQTQFVFNDSTNTLVSYILRSDSEVIDRFIDSMVDTGRNALNTQNLAANNGFGVGLDFDEMVDLSNQKFSIQLNSGITSLVPMVLYAYFHSFVEL
jgi:hypothetical protein